MRPYAVSRRTRCIGRFRDACTAGKVDEAKGGIEVPGTAVSEGQLLLRDRVLLLGEVLEGMDRCFHHVDRIVVVAVLAQGRAHLQTGAGTVTMGQPIVGRKVLVLARRCLKFADRLRDDG
ncbi:hypothetical protein QFZ82_006594 [Streptomyces sp. V4I23]|nr:hypothetical protein [Streptomyces sp. V4I23]